MRAFWYVLLLSLYPLHGALSQSPMGLGILYDNHVFVLTVVAVNAPPWKDDDSSGTEARTLSVKFQLDKNIRGDLDLNEGATAVVDLKQVRYPHGAMWDNPEFWSYRDLIPGQSWLIGEEGTATDLQTLLHHPKLAEMVSGSTTVQDVEFMNQNYKLPVAEQADKLAEWLEQTQEARGYHIGEYAAKLLANPAGAANMNLEKMAEDGALEKRLIEDGQYAFLLNLYLAKRNSAVLPDSTVRIFTRATIEFLFASGHDPAGRRQRDIIQNYLPWFVALPQAKSILRETMNKSRRRQIVAQLQGLASSSRLSSTDRETLVNLRELISNKSPQ